MNNYLLGDTNLCLYRLAGNGMLNGKKYYIHWIIFSLTVWKSEVKNNLISWAYFPDMSIKYFRKGYVNELKFITATSSVI